jgi:hypothetical protein
MGGLTSGRRGARYSGGARRGGVKAGLWLEAVGDGAMPMEEGGDNVLGASTSLRSSRRFRRCNTERTWCLVRRPKSMMNNIEK